MYRIGICDDERGTCAKLEEILYKCAENRGLKFDISVWYTGEELCEYLRQDNNLDMLFLDIELISTDGIKVGNFIREELEDIETDIVYISSNSSYAMSLFRIQPIDFLIKPLDERRIEEVMLRAIKQYERKRQMFDYQIKGCFYQLHCKEILYFYSENKKIVIVTKADKIIFNGKIKEIAKRLPYNFIQIHQSFIVNMDYVEECTYEMVRMRDKAELSISQPYRKSVREQIMKYKWEKMN